MFKLKKHHIRRQFHFIACVPDMAMELLRFLQFRNGSKRLLLSLFTPTATCSLIACFFFEHKWTVSNYFCDVLNTTTLCMYTSTSGTLSHLTLCKHRLLFLFRTDLGLTTTTIRYSLHTLHGNPNPPFIPKTSLKSTWEKDLAVILHCCPPNKLNLFSPYPLLKMRLFAVEPWSHQVKNLIDKTVVGVDISRGRFVG